MSSFIKRNRINYRNIVSSAVVNIAVDVGVTKSKSSPKKIKPVKLIRRKIILSADKIIETPKVLIVGVSSKHAKQSHDDTVLVAIEQTRPMVTIQASRKRKRDINADNEVDSVSLCKKLRFDQVSVFEVNRTERKRKRDDSNINDSEVMPPRKKLRLT